MIVAAQNTPCKGENGGEKEKSFVTVLGTIVITVITIFVIWWTRCRRRERDVGVVGVLVEEPEGVSTRVAPRDLRYSRDEETSDTDDAQDQHDFQNFDSHRRRMQEWRREVQEYRERQGEVLSESDDDENSSRGTSRQEIPETPSSSSSEEITATSSTTRPRTTSRKTSSGNARASLDDLENVNEENIK